MTSQSKGRTLPETRIRFSDEPKTRRQLSGQAPDAVRLRSGVTLSFPTMRRWHATLNKALASPRGASTAHALADMAADIAALLGPAMDPDHVPEVKPLAKGYVLTMPDGTEHTLLTSTDAAKRLGLSPQSLRVYLSRGKGTYVRKTPDGAITLRRIYAERT